MTRERATDDFHFEGFEGPNTTPVPDVVFDRLLARLGEAELKALLYIIRRTFGFKRDRDPISFNQFLRGITTRDGRVLDDGCGVRSRTTLSTALKSLEEKGIITSEKGMDERGENVTTIYRLRFKDEHDREVVRNSYHPSTDRIPPVVRNSYPQETVLQETGVHNSNIRMGSPDVEKGGGQTPAPPRSSPRRGGTVSVAELLAPERQRLAEQISSRRPSPEAPGVEEGDPAVRANGHATSPAEGDAREAVTSRNVAADGSPAPADVASTQPTVPRRRGRPPKAYSEDRQVILAYIEDFAREFNDKAPLKSSVTRAYHLFERSGLSREAFIAKLYQARAITKEQSATIRLLDDQPGRLSPKRKMPYWFAVLEDVLGLRDEPGAARPG